jgi:hypothetical protein
MTLLALLAAPWVARAENPLSFSYLELAGTPVLNNTRTTPVLDGETELEGSGGDLVFSLAVHKNWFFMLQWDSSRQESDNYLGLANLGIQNDLKIKQELLRFAPHFNYRVHPRVEVFLGLGFQWGDSTFELEVDGERISENDSEIGLFVRAGARGMVWRGLELFADFNGSNLALVENDMLFNVGARYHFLHDAFDVGVGGRFGTNDLQALNLSARIYYAELWRWARGN